MVIDWLVEALFEVIPPVVQDTTLYNFTEIH